MPTAPLRLGALDPCTLRSGRTAEEALRESVEIARSCDGFGYHRFWLAEHHNTAAFASAAPEAALGTIAASTRRIRVGTGGVLLGHYSALKVAETFRLLEALHPGRIDLGIGRNPGGEPHVVNRPACGGRAETGGARTASTPPPPSVMRVRLMSKSSPCPAPSSACTYNL